MMGSLASQTHERVAREGLVSALYSNLYSTARFLRGQ